MLYQAGADRVFGGWRIFGERTGRARMQHPITRNHAWTKPRAPAGCISSPVTPRTKSPNAAGLACLRPAACLAVSPERLITFRLEHPIAACMELAARLKELFQLVYCEVVPADPAPLSAAGICRAGRQHPGIDAAHREAHHRGAGHGRAVRAAVERVSPIDAPTTRSCRWSETSRPTLRELLRYRWPPRRPHQGAPLSYAAAVF